MLRRKLHAPQVASQTSKQIFNTHIVYLVYGKYNRLSCSSQYIGNLAVLICNTLLYVCYKYNYIGCFYCYFSLIKYLF